jgi:hypothetical protein
MKNTACFIAIAFACLLLSACDPTTTIEIKNDTGHAVEIKAENRSLATGEKTVVLQPGEYSSARIMGWAATTADFQAALKNKVIVFSLRDLVTGKTIAQEQALELALAHVKQDEKYRMLWRLSLKDLLQ